MIHRAMLFATTKHAVQQRKQKTEKYILHPSRVAGLSLHYLSLCPMLDYNTVLDGITSAILHDVLEDCDCTVEEISKEFGATVASIVVALTNVYIKSKYPHLSRKERKGLEFYRIAEVGGVIGYVSRIIKLIDRYDNIRDFKLLGDDYYLKYAKEGSQMIDIFRDKNPYEKYFDLPELIRGFI